MRKSAGNDASLRSRGRGQSSKATDFAMPSGFSTTLHRASHDSEGCGYLAQLRQLLRPHRPLI